MSEKEQGKRYSHLYLLRGEPEKDSKRARFRLSKLAEQYFAPAGYKGKRRSPDYQKRAIESIESEIGIQFASRSQSGRYLERWDWFFKRVEITILLDVVTILSGEFKYRESGAKERFLEHIRRIFKEENLAYEIDAEGGVHPLIDSAFTSGKQLAISGLASPRYIATAQSLEKIDGSLLEDPADYKGAIRSVFGACENLFKLMYGVPRLDSQKAGELIGKDQQSLYSAHPTLQAASSKMLESFKDWINSAHFYRHEEGTEEPNQPAEEVAILLISQGLSYVRWLAKLDTLKE
ncbi:hypothetical protein [Sagittula sp. MA-2]|jgi:hypothetical protein|uniref:hypothetical protein n=1 Tax=Sagittula sp. MA-2 TaxID=3048007 RepID=UPI0024C352E3|nr:hypothetical protein [Sagittula sp. MA-2]WHZ37509.1 hypothetical protein QNI11_10915 [Sagittula sp. MA-2]